jgi:hypothetical protein
LQIQIWHDEPAVKVSGLAVSSLGFWLTSDNTKPLPSSFTLLINARVFGVQVGTVSIDPMKNGTFSMPLLASIGGTVQGRIDDWNAYDKNGQPINETADPKWATADSVRFTVTGIADVTITATTVASIVPGLGWVAKAALAVLGNKVKISIAHESVSVHLPHGSQ